MSGGKGRHRQGCESWRSDPLREGKTCTARGISWLLLVPCFCSVPRLQVTPLRSTKTKSSLYQRYSFRGSDSLTRTRRVSQLSLPCQEGFSRQATDWESGEAAKERSRGQLGRPTWKVGSILPPPSMAGVLGLKVLSLFVPEIWSL